MYDDEEHRRYGESPRLEPIVEQHDDEMTTSPMSNSSIGINNYLGGERRSQEEIQQFEELEKELASPRRGIRVKFDDEQQPPVTQITVIKTEPCFKVNSSEDQVTKHFYHNEYQAKEEKDNQFFRQIPSKTPSEPDSLEEEYLLTMEEKDGIYELNEDYKEIYRQTIDVIPSSSSSPSRSILKKSPKKESKSDRSSISRSPSPSSLKKKQTTSDCPDSNQVQHLAGATAKQTLSKVCPLSHRSLFEPTINIFDSSNSTTRRPSRLQYYIKPYRGEAYIRPKTTKQYPRSLSEHRLAQQSGPTAWYTFANQYNRPLNKRQHISWSPVREYIHQGRDKTPTKKKELFPSPLSIRSSSNPCLRSSSSSSPSMIPVSIRYRSSQIPNQSLPLSSLESYETSSLINYPLTPNSQSDETKELLFQSPLLDIVHSQTNEHVETIQRYDRLLEKMRATDEQLKLLSRSWTNNTQPKASTRSQLPLNKTTSKKAFISPMILQICLLILVIFNLLVVYFFNEINVFWSQYIARSVTTEQSADEKTTTNF